MTFWPRFSISRNDLRNRVKVEDMCTLRPAPSTEFRGGSCCDSQIGWGPHTCKVLPGGIIAESKTPVNIHVELWLGNGAGGWRQAGGRDWGMRGEDLNYVIFCWITLMYVKLHYLTLFYVILRYLTLSYVILRYLTISYVILGYLTLSYVILRYLLLIYPNLRFNFTEFLLICKEIVR
jgi:hypothetical protein